MDFEPAWPLDMRLLSKVPLPVAQLAARAPVEDSPRVRHDTALCAFDAFLRLLASLVIAEAGQRQPVAAHTVNGLSTGDVLVKPYWNDWLERVRTGNKALQAAGDRAFRLLFDKVRDRFPACRALCDQLRALVAPEAPFATLADLLQLLATYRNQVCAHHCSAYPAAVEPDFEQIGRQLLVALLEILATETAFGGRRFVYVESAVEVAPRTWRIEHLELSGLLPVRLQPLTLDDVEREAVPAKDAVYAVNPAAVPAEAPATMYSAASCVGLHPLVKYFPPRQECWFAERDDSESTGPESIRYIGHIDCLTLDSSEQVDLLGANLAQQSLEPPRAATTEKRTPFFGLEGRADKQAHGEFQIVGQLAAGKYAYVFRAWQPSVERYVALKQVRSDAPGRAEVEINNEIHLLGRVTHPNLIQVLTRGYAPSWFTMPLVSGPTLGDVLTALRGFDVRQVTPNDFRNAIYMAAGAAEERIKRLSREGRFPERGEEQPAASTAPAPADPGETYLSLVCGLVARVASAVETLHRSAIVHANLHPDNVLVSLIDLCPMLIDLSDAERLGQSASEPSPPPASRLPYGSPQQVRAPYSVDQAADVYHLGVLCWELLTLRPMFDITSKTGAVDAILRVQYDRPEPPSRYNPSVPKCLDDVVSRCLAKEVDERLPSAAQLYRVLSAVERSELERRPRRSWPFSFFIASRATDA